MRVDWDTEHGLPKLTLTAERAEDVAVLQALVQVETILQTWPLPDTDERVD